MGTSLKDICMVSGIVIEDSHNEFSNDWFFVVRIEIACFECGNHESSVFGAHVVAISKLQKPSHLFEVVCKKCATFLTSTWRSQLVEESEIEYLARILPGSQLNCTTCHRDKFRGTLDSLGSLAHTNPVPIVSSDLVTNTTQVVPVLNLSTYFTQKVTLSVPPWQREYTWDATSEDGEVAVLLEDLKQFVEDEQKSEYLLGAVILCKTDDPKVVYLIDGQQRTVTLTLLIMCCYQHLKENEALSAEHFRFQTKIHNMITSSEYGYKPHVNFTQENANKILAQIWDWLNAESERGAKFIEETETYSRTQNNLLSVVGFISKKLQNEDWFKTTDLVPALEKILDGVKLIQLQLEGKREAIQAYDRINHRGLRLNDADLIKNQLFELVDDKAFDEISESWQGMVQSLQESKSGKFQDPKYLIRAHAWTVSDGKKITYDELSDFYKDKYLGTKQDPLPFAQELELFATSLVNYIKHKHVRHGDLPLLLPSQMLGSVQHFPVLLAGDAIASKESFTRLYHQVASRTLLYVLSKERPPEFESYIPKWAGAVRKAGKAVTPEELDAIYNEFAFGSLETAAVTKEKLINNLHLQMDSWRVGNSADKKKIRASLAVMSWWLDQLCEKTFPDIDDFFKTRKTKNKGWDIEHIAAVAYENEHINLDQKHSIGNLALLSPLDQRGAKNAPPSDKLAIYTQSVLVLSKTVTGESLTPRMNKVRDEIYSACQIEPAWSLATWDSKAINARQEFYKSFMTAIVNMELPLPE